MTKSEIITTTSGVRFYYAYGSNLSLKQMARRCPDARPVRKLTIRGWKLVFRGSADIQPGTRDDVVHGALYAMSPEDEDLMDDYEGVAGNRQGLYRKVDFKINATGEEAFFYVMNRGDVCPPSETYYTTILRGFRDWGLPVGALRKAAKLAATTADAMRAQGKVVRGLGRGSRK